MSHWIGEGLPRRFGPTIPRQNNSHDWDSQVDTGISAGFGRPLLYVYLTKFQACFDKLSFGSIRAILAQCLSRPSGTSGWAHETSHKTWVENPIHTKHGQIVDLQLGPVLPQIQPPSKSKGNVGIQVVLGDTVCRTPLHRTITGGWGGHASRFSKYYLDEYVNYGHTDDVQEFLFHRIWQGELN